jgi:hypothetical protein
MLLDGTDDNLREGHPRTVPMEVRRFENIHTLDDELALGSN